MSTEKINAVLYHELEVPPDVARCLVCDGSLLAKPFRCEPETGLIAEEGFFLWCVGDQAMGANRRTRIADGDRAGWQRVKECVFRWLSDYVRVVPRKEQGDDQG
jgi:hypothetical protein